MGSSASVKKTEVEIIANISKKDNNCDEANERYEFK